MNYYVYKITNKVNGHFYIGKRSCRCDISEDRYTGSGEGIILARRKYGSLNFSKEILGTFGTEQEAYDYEREVCTLVEVDDPNCYNRRVGGLGDVVGVGNCHYGVPKSAIHRQRIGNANRGKKRSPECVEGMRERQIGNRHSLESRFRMSEQRKGSGNVRARLSETQVLLVRKLNKVCGWRIVQCAELLNMHQGTVGHAISGRTWRHI